MNKLALLQILLNNAPSKMCRMERDTVSLLDYLVTQKIDEAEKNNIEKQIVKNLTIPSGSLINELYFNRNDLSDIVYLFKNTPKKLMSLHEKVSLMKAHIIACKQRLLLFRKETRKAMWNVWRKKYQLTYITDIQFVASISSSFKDLFETQQYLDASEMISKGASLIKAYQTMPRIKELQENLDLQANQLYSVVLEELMKLVYQTSKENVLQFIQCRFSEQECLQPTRYRSDDNYSMIHYFVKCLCNIRKLEDALRYILSRGKIEFKRVICKILPMFSECLLTMPTIYMDDQDKKMQYFCGFIDLLYELLDAIMERHRCISKVINAIGTKEVIYIYDPDYIQFEIEEIFSFLIKEYILLTKAERKKKKKFPFTCENICQDFHFYFKKETRKKKQKFFLFKFKSSSYAEALHSNSEETDLSLEWTLRSPEYEFLVILISKI